MTATGIVRRIDDLGRVVIPKEIRRKLKWRPGSPVEVFITADGIVCLKKYTSMGEDAIIAQKLADNMAQACKCVVCITDMDRVIAAAGCPKSQLIDKDISTELENAINARKLLVTERMPIVISLDSDEIYPYAVIAPVITEGDPEGAVVIMSKDTCIGEKEILLARTVTMFLSERFAA